MQVAGESNLTQLCECLRRYSDRESFIRAVLTHLYSHTSDTEEPQPHILKVQKSLLLSDLYLLAEHEQAGLLESAISISYKENEKSTLKHIDFNIYADFK